MSTNYAQELLDKRARAWEQAKEILDRCAAEKRERSAEEETMYERANADIVRYGREADEILDSERQKRELDQARESIADIVRPEVDEVNSRREMSALEHWFRTGENRGLKTYRDGNKGGVEIDLAPAARMFNQIRNGIEREDARAEYRAIYTDGGASAGSIVVPSTWAMQLYQYVEASSTIRKLSNVITTSNGGPMNFEKVVTHGVAAGTIVQGTAITGTDPVFGTMTLNAYKYGQLIKVSNEAADDVGFDLLGFVAQNIGRAVGRKTDTAYVLGAGSTDPNGIITAASVGATTGGSLIALGGGAATTFTQNLDALIALQFSVVAEYRDRGAFVMNDATAGTVRKVKDGGAGTIGAYLWTPSTTFDSVAGLRTPDILFGSPVYTDTNFGTNGSAVKPVAFGAWDAYYIRDAGGFRIERSDDYAFNTDEIAFRGVIRTDADLIDAGAIKVLQQAV